MACCERCWAEAYTRWFWNPEKSQADYYEDLLTEKKDHPCSQTEQRGKKPITSD